MSQVVSSISVNNAITAITGLLVMSIMSINQALISRLKEFHFISVEFEERSL